MSEGDGKPTPLFLLRAGRRYKVLLCAETVDGEFTAVFHGWDDDGLTDEFSKMAASTVWDNGVRVAGRDVLCWDMKGWDEA